MKSLKLLFFLSVTSIFAQVPANNECTNAETIIVSATTTLSISADFTEATESLDASCNTATTDNKDLWYQFIMPIDGNLFIDGPSTLNYFTLYNACGGAEIACSQDDASFGNLVNGNTYLLRASYQFSSSTSFSVIAFEPASNDDCVNSQTITVETANYIEYTTDSRTATESMDASCDIATNDNLDLWYEFVMPVNGNIEIKAAAQFQNQTYSIFDACGGLELDCVYDRGFFLNLAAETTYILRISDKAGNAGSINFRIQAFEFETNNDCANSQTITVETANSNDYAINLKKAFESINASCEIETDDNLDLWYDFVMPVNGNLSLKQLSGLKVALYDGCSGSELSCNAGAQFVYGLTSGTNYKLRISSTVPVTRTLKIQAFEVALNDECIDSVLITVETANQSEYIADTRRATESLDGSCEAATSDNLDLWYEFVMPVSGNLQISNVSFQFKSALYDACSGTEIDCLIGNDSFLNLSFGTTYKLRVAQRFNDASLVNFRLQAFENIFNDECTSPQNIVLEINVNQSYSVNVAAATESVISVCEPDGGDTFNVLDVWYSFTMPINGDVQINDLTSSTTQYFSLYETCGVTDIQCFTNDGMFTGLTSGNTYQLKVSMLSSVGSGVLDFSIQALDSSLSIEEKELEHLSIFPNPTCNSLTISNRNQLQLKHISIYDLSGRKVKIINFGNELGDKTIDISELQNAMYVLVISSENVEITRRIIKK